MNPFDNRQQIATAPAGLVDYITLYLPARESNAGAGLISLVNDAIVQSDLGNADGVAVDQLVRVIRIVNELGIENFITQAKRLRWKRSRLRESRS